MVHKLQKIPYGPPRFNPAYLAAVAAHIDNFLVHPDEWDKGMIASFREMRSAIEAAQAGDSLTDMRILERLHRCKPYNGNSNLGLVLNHIYPIQHRVPK